MNFKLIESKAQYEKIVDTREMQRISQICEQLSFNMTQTNEEKNTLNGNCLVCNKTVDFAFDWMHAHEGKINFRERLVCPNCNLNNRQGGMISLCLSVMTSYKM